MGISNYTTRKVDYDKWKDKEKAMKISMKKLEKELGIIQVEQKLSPSEAATMAINQICDRIGMTNEALLKYLWYKIKAKQKTKDLALAFKVKGLLDNVTNNNSLNVMFNNVVQLPMRQIIDNINKEL